MKISRTYILIYSILIFSTLAFAVFVLMLQLSDSNFPYWMSAVSLSFVVVSIGSFVRNFRTIKIEQDNIILKRLYRADRKFHFSEIENIKEGTFRYRGSSPTSNLYEGYFLTIKTKSQKIRTTSLNEPEYKQLRKNLKARLQKKVKLDEKYRGDNLNQFLLIIICLPGIYLLFKILGYLSGL
ncbi:hypothetical protein Oweho_0325 [Owenweeksia hongkongensis DSM 17368]|uniref:Uncharacterized protein n=1 Tax=Owenweeksia hongkongensis (strain DSM 17368 / CIP 108786 / JCM 12287 / NRRL B-23963 / UST20020801) TaxID=926562 RepID=G8R823_OWEHD|nr:hypothetical protein [Owenweeksia hongkongensis]AEV31346.1 hypothetical protein Oweho_0325 [Owenweeksia hongkongensis DSM 17368]